MQNTKMLWRESFRPEVHREFRPLPPLELQSVESGLAHQGGPSLAYLIGAGLDSLREQELWLRLFQSQFDLSATIAVVTLVSDLDSTQVDLQNALPASRRAIWFTSQTLADWQSRLPGLSGKRAALVLPKAGIAVVGPATEDVWEEVADLLREERKKL